MGLLKNAFKKELNKTVNKTVCTFFNGQVKNQQPQERPAESVIREKQKLAEDIRVQARFQAQQYLKIVNDCATLVNTTVNPDVFFKRYHLMLENLESLAGLECTGIFDNSPELPSDTFLRVEAQFDAATIDFLDRSFDNAKAKADTLKTEKGKLNSINRYFDDMENFIIYMNGEGLEYLDKLKEIYTIPTKGE